MKIINKVTFCIIMIFGVISLVLINLDSTQDTMYTKIILVIFVLSGFINLLTEKYIRRDK